MKFKLEAKFSKNQIEKQLNQAVSNLRQAVLNRLEMVGWEFVRNARMKNASQGGFNDVTGNLRSSIGFAIIDHGKVSKENYEASKTGTDKKTGISEAKSLVKSLKSDFANGYALVVVAGMGYAAAVESRGKDVITGSSLEAEEMLKEALKKMRIKVSS